MNKDDRIKPERNRSEPNTRRAWPMFLLIFVLLAAGIVIAGFCYYRNYKQQFRAEVERNLSAIAELKADRLAEWRRARFGDANILYQNPSFTDLVRRFLDKPDDPVVRRSLQTWLNKYKTYPDYGRVFLIDTVGVIRMSAPEALPMGVSSLARDAAICLGSGQITCIDLHRDSSDGFIHMTIMAPIFDEQDGLRPLGVIALRIDPNNYLYPFIMRWPTPSPTAETLLVRRDGNDALFLNELKFQTNTALNLRIPLDKTEAPAVKAALGQSGIVEGRAYRDVQVIAALCAVPDSPWFLVAHMDAAEVYAPLRERLWLIVLLMGVLLLGAGAGIAAIWRQQSVWFYKERARAAESLKKSIQLLNDTGEMAKVGGWELDIATKEVTWTEEVCRIHRVALGYKPKLEEAVNFYAPESKPVLEAALKKAMETGEPFDLECLFIPSGSKDKIWVRALGKTVCSDGKIVKLAGTFQNIDKYKRMRDALRESEARYKALFTSAAEGILVADMQTRRFHYANPAVCRMFGYTEEELLRIGVADIHPKESLDHVLSEFAAQARGKTMLAPDLPCRRKDGAIFYANVSTIRMILDGRDCNVGFFTDITARKLAEEELRKMRHLKSIGTLAGGIAHDFNNILLGLFGNISLAKAELLNNHPGFAFLEKAEKSMREAARLTRRLITFAEGGEPIKEVTNIGNLVEEVVRFNLSGSKVMPVFEWAEGLWLAEVDREQVQLVFSSLTINAKKAMPDGGHLYITLANADIPGNTVPNLNQGKYIKVAVRDEGAGMDQQQLARIFDPYFSAGQNGSGLELAATYSILNKHGGHISVASKPGKGTTFTLYLPASELQQLPEASQPEPEPLAMQRTVKILLMDDNKTVLEVVAQMLGRMGFLVETALEGKRVIERYKQALDAGAPFDAVIMDLAIPGGIGGKEAIKGILEIDPEAKAIVSSGYADDDVMAHYTEYGFKGIVIKPYTMEILQEVLSQVLKT